MHTLTGKQLHQAFLDGQHSATEITEYFLDRIATLDPKIKAFLTVFHDRARAKAKVLDEKRAAGKPLGKLAGVPIAIKDNIHIRGETTTCASKFLTNYVAPFDATVVKLLEKEDAILMGKTNLDEFAMGSSTENSAFHPTHNPWNLACSPGGSSGGSASAVAARMVPIAFGSDTGGSVRQPGSFTGTVGYKPSYGRLSRFGLVAFGSSLDQIGPITNSVEDIAMVMEVLGTHDEHDSTSMPNPAEEYQLGQTVKGTKVGVPYSLLTDLQDPAKTMFEESVNKLKELGCEIVDVNLDASQYAIAVYYILATAEASTNLARFDGVRYGVRSERAQTLDQVYDYSKEEGYGPEVKRRIMLGTYVLSAGFQDAYYSKAQKARAVMIEEYRKAFEKCDFVAMPVSPGVAFEIGSIADPLTLYLADIFTSPANLVGIPAISVPAGFSKEGLPMGLQIQGPRAADVAVCQLADAFEQATQYNKRMPELAS